MGGEKGHVHINVTLGVLHKDVEELYSKLTGNDSSVIQHTIGLQIGYFMPENSFKEWDFIENGDNYNTYEDLLNCIQAYGFKYFDKMKDFNNLFEAFEKRTPGLLNQARDRYLPILYYLKGEKLKGLQFIEEAIENQKKPVSEEKLQQLLKLAGPGGQVIIGSGYNGKVDPLYLQFVEAYKKL